MSNTTHEQKYELECHRLASDFMQLSRDTLDRDLQAQYVRMAAYWNDQADGGSNENLTSSDDLDR